MRTRRWALCWVLVVAVTSSAGCANELDTTSVSASLAGEEDPSAPEVSPAAPGADVSDLERKTTRELSAEMRALKAKGQSYYNLTHSERARFDALARARARRQSSPVEAREPFDPDGFLGDPALADPGLDDPGPPDPGSGGDL